LPFLLFFFRPQTPKTTTYHHQNTEHFTTKGIAKGPETADFSTFPGFLVGEGGFEPPKAVPADLQSAFFVDFTVKNLD